MKTKICAICGKEEIILFRISIAVNNDWIFVCKSCCVKSKQLPNYKYGGTWKGNRH